MTKYLGDAQVLGEYTGGALPPAWVATAREDQVSMLDNWEVWDVITEGEAWQLAGERPLQCAWVGCNKGGAARR